MRKIFKVLWKAGAAMFALAAFAVLIISTIILLGKAVTFLYTNAGSNAAGAAMLVSFFAGVFITIMVTE